MRLVLSASGPSRGAKAIDPGAGMHALGFAVLARIGVADTLRQRAGNLGGSRSGDGDGADQCQPSRDCTSMRHVTLPRLPPVCAGVCRDYIKPSKKSYRILWHSARLGRADRDRLTPADVQKGRPDRTTAQRDAFADAWGGGGVGRRGERATIVQRDAVAPVAQTLDGNDFGLCDPPRCWRQAGRSWRRVGMDGRRGGAAGGRATAGSVGVFRAS